MPRAVPVTSGSWSAPSTTRPPGPSPRSATWPPTASAVPGYRTEPLPDQWELYDLDADPVEAANRADDPIAADVVRPAPRPPEGGAGRRRCPSATSLGPTSPAAPTPESSRRPRPSPPGSCAGPVQRLGMHPEDADATAFDLPGRRALVVATNHGVLDVGKPTGVFASELTVPYYLFLDAGMDVDVASPAGGIDPGRPDVAQAGRPLRRADDRFLGDTRLRAKVTDSLAIGELDMADYDIVFLAGGWGAAFDFGVSRSLADKVTEAAAAGAVLGRHLPRPARALPGHGTRRSAPGRGPPGHRGHRQAGAGAGHRVHAVPPRDRAAEAGAAVRVGHPLPGPPRQPLGRRRRPRDRPEPERRAHGRPGDAPPGGRPRP